MINNKEVRQQEMDKAIKCLALELPELVWHDVNRRWQEFKQSLTPTDASSKAEDRVKEVMNEDGGCWQPCSGCHETVDGQETGDYNYSNVYKCYTGSGCHECGGIGVIWHDGESLKNYPAPSTQPGGQSYPTWVKASERLPDKKGKENSVVIKNESKDNFFVTTGFVNFSKDHPAIYFELGFSSYLTVHDKGNGKTTFPIENIYWLEENPSPSTQDTYQIFKGDEVNSFLAVIMRVLNDDQKKALHEALGERLSTKEERRFTLLEALEIWECGYDQGNWDENESGAHLGEHGDEKFNYEKKNKYFLQKFNIQL